MKKLPSLRALLQGGAGVAFAVLLPRAMSLGIQWLLALSAGPAAVAELANYMSRGMVAVSLVAAGLTPTLARRTRALSTRGGRALAGGALAVLAALAFTFTLAYEQTAGLRGVAGLVTAIFSACSLFAAVSPSIWPIWQREGRYLQSLAPLLVLSPGVSAMAALAGHPAAVCIANGLASATPALLLVRPTRIRRAVRYAMIAIRRAVPYSIANFSTVVVYPISLSANMALIDDHLVGQQVLYWSFVVALSIASQSFAARAVVEASALPDEASRQARALRGWLPAAAALALVGAAIYALFAVPIPQLPRSGAAHDAMTPTMLVSGMAPLITDPMSVYFSGERSRRALPIGSALSSACMAAWLVLLPAPLVRHFGVFGPSVLVGVMRLAFVIDAPSRRYARGALLLLLSAFALALALGRSVGV
ncbi:hypothetical protein WME90_38150 [Sorangium sp. So ce375]|uniref:hypothetical protein n=1 Tax=Sorangium sp. So ce375 TaxID=3133306 RepID=UPI003F5B9AB8